MVGGAVVHPSMWVVDGGTVVSGLVVAAAVVVSASFVVI